MVEGRIFVSHSTRDYASIVDPLVDLLDTGMGLDIREVFCSNTPGLDIPPGVGFMEHIKQRLHEASLTIHVVTPAYLDSQFCLLELGAAWERGSCFPLVVAPLSMERLQRGPLGGMQLKMLDEQGLDSLRDTVRESLGRELPVARWTDRRDRFLGMVKSVSASRQPLRRLTAAGVRGHHLEVWKITEDGSVFHRWWPRDSTQGDWHWDEWIEFPVPGNAAEIAATSSGSEHAAVFVLDARGHVWYREWQLNSNWSGWHPLGGLVQGPISAASLRDGHVEVFAQSASGSGLLHRWRDSPSDGWSDGWLPLN
jgi:hypothetical protein